MDRLFQFFFKHSPTVFEKGQFSFAARPPLWALALVALLAGLLVYFLYFRGPQRAATAPRLALTGLRVALIGLLAFMLMRPVMVVSSVIPKSNSVAVLADDSRSMQLKDEGGRALL
jgi:xanthosine utilization system XapX-like protein